MSRLLVRFGGIAGILVVLLVLSISTVMATSAMGGKLRYGDSVVVPANETVDSDLYAAGGTVTVNGHVTGDLVAAAGTIVVNGTVDGDIIAAGGTLELGGTVGHAVRVGGGQITFSGTVTGDVLSASGTMTVASQSHVGGDLIFSAGQATVNGDVAGSIEGQATAYSRSGSVGAAEHVTINQPSAAPPIVPPSNAALDALRHFVVVVLFGALGLWLMPRGLMAAEEAIRKRPLTAFGGGLLTVVGYIAVLIALLILMVVLAIAFGLLTLGSVVLIDVALWLLASTIITFVFVVGAAYAADAVVGLALARLVLPAGGASRWQELALLAAGGAGVVIVTTIPFIGPIAKFVVVLVGLGALVLVAWGAWQGRRGHGAPPMVSAPPQPPAAPLGA
jgi:cytoskeletal protein CcmA (bactofilin family)